MSYVQDLLMDSMKNSQLLSSKNTRALTDKQQEKNKLDMHALDQPKYYTNQTLSSIKDGATQNN